MDPKYLNEAVKRGHGTIHPFEEITSKLVSEKFFSTLDATNVFYQIPLNEPTSDL